MEPHFTGQRKCTLVQAFKTTISNTPSTSLSEVERNSAGDPPNEEPKKISVFHKIQTEIESNGEGDEVEEKEVMEKCRLEPTHCTFVFRTETNYSNCFLSFILVPIHLCDQHKAKAQKQKPRNERDLGKEQTL